MRGHRAGHGAPDIVVMAESLNERDHDAPGEHRHGHAEIGQVPDSTLGAVDVIVEEDVPGPHRLERKIAHDGLDERRVRSSGELAAPPVVDSRAEVARLADHGRARCALDRRLDLGLHGGERALDDLEDNRVDRRLDDVHVALHATRRPA